MPPANRPPNDDLAPGKSHPRSRATAEKSTSSTSDQFRLPSVYPTWSPTSTFEPSSSNPLRQPLHFEGSRLDVDPQTSLGHHQEPRRPDSFIVPVTISPQSLQRHPGDRLSFDYSSSAYYPSSHGLIDYGNPFDRTNATSTASLGDLGILTTTASDMNELAPMAFMGTGASHSSICVTNSGSEANVSQEVTTTPFMKSESEESQNNFAGEPQSNVEDLVFMSHTINLEPEQDVQQGAHPAPSSGSCFKCGICEKTFTRSYNLQNHQQTHEVYRERPFVCMRWGCFKGFYRPSELKRHELSVRLIILGLLNRLLTYGRSMSKSKTLFVMLVTVLSLGRTPCRGESTPASHSTIARTKSAIQGTRQMAVIKDRMHELANAKSAMSLQPARHLPVRKEKARAKRSWTTAILCCRVRMRNATAARLEGRAGLNLKLELYPDKKPATAPKKKRILTCWKSLILPSHTLRNGFTFSRR